MKDESTSQKSSSQTKQVWKEKATISKSPSQEVQPSRSPSSGPTDAPKENKKKTYLSCLEDHCSTQQTQSSTLDLDKSTFNSLEKRSTAISIVISLMNSQRGPALGGDVDHPETRRINLQRMNGRKIRHLKKM